MLITDRDGLPRTRRCSVGNRKGNPVFARALGTGLELGTAIRPSPQVPIHQAVP